MAKSTDPEAKIREIRRKTRRRDFTERKIRIFLERLKGEETLGQYPRSASPARTSVHQENASS